MKFVVSWRRGLGVAALMAAISIFIVPDDRVGLATATTLVLFGSHFFLWSINSWTTGQYKIFQGRTVVGRPAKYLAAFQGLFSMGMIMSGLFGLYLSL